MGLRKIKRESEGGRFHLPSLRPKSHFSKLSKGAGFHMGESDSNKLKMPGLPLGGGQTKRFLPIIIIAIIAIGIIAVEVYLWGGKEHVGDEKDMANISGDTNQTPLKINDSDVKEPKPLGVDLEMRSVKLGTDEVTVGDPLTIDATVKNSGEKDLINVTVGFYFGETAIKKVVIDHIKAGDTADVEVNWTATEDDVGKDDIIAFADPNKKLAEDDEDNNDMQESLEVKKNVVEDVSADFTQKSVSDFTKYWYSDKFKIPPGSGDGYTYFQLSSAGANMYYLDVSIAGFLATKQNAVYKIQIPSASDSGWNGDNCIRESHDSDACIWFGPEIQINLDFSKSTLTAKDQDGEISRVSSKDYRITEVRLDGMRTAKWPDEISVFKVLGSPEPNSLVPSEFYEYADKTLYIYPMRWNPKTKNAEVMTWLRLELVTG